MVCLDKKDDLDMSAVGRMHVRHPHLGGLRRAGCYCYEIIMFLFTKCRAMWTTKIRLQGYKLRWK